MSYNTPGQYITENSNVNKPIQGSSQGIAAFIGICQFGPLNTATLVSSFADFVSKFGSYISTSYLAYAVEVFFKEAGEGASCYITRVVHYTDITDLSTCTAISAYVTLRDSLGAAALVATSTIEETTGNSYRVSISDATIPTAHGNFTDVGNKIVVINFSKAMKATTLIQGYFSSAAGGAITAFVKDASNEFVTITFTNVLTTGDTVVMTAAITDNETVPNPLPLAYRIATKGTALDRTFKVEVFLVNTSVAIDSLDNVTNDDMDDTTLATVLFTSSANLRPVNIVKAVLASGSTGVASMADADYIGSVITGTGLYSLDLIEEDLNIVIPGITTRPVILAASDYAEAKKSFYIGDIPSGLTYAEAKTFKLATGTYVGSIAIDSAFCALYYPWYYIKDPTIANTTKLMPVSAAMAGVYSRTAFLRGVHKAPAGVEDGKLKTALGVERIVSDTQQGDLNPIGVNVIRSFSGFGVVAWGARTTSTDEDWKYINVRLHFNYIISSIINGTKWSVFEPNDKSLWSKLSLFCNSFLKKEFLKGAFADGASGVPSESYYVICNSSNNTVTNVADGQYNISIGLAESKPGEFLICNISQWDGGKVVT